MPLAARILFGVFGLVVAVYAAASLSGNWLSTAPWWERATWIGDIDIGNRRSTDAEFERAFQNATRVEDSLFQEDRRLIEPRPGRELISVGVGAVALAALAFAAWTRRQPGSA